MAWPGTEGPSAEETGQLVRWSFHTGAGAVADGPPAGAHRRVSVLGRQWREFFKTRMLTGGRAFFPLRAGEGSWGRKEKGCREDFSLPRTIQMGTRTSAPRARKGRRWAPRGAEPHCGLLPLPLPSASPAQALSPPAAKDNLAFTSTEGPPPLPGEMAPLRAV